MATTEQVTHNASLTAGQPRNPLLLVLLVLALLNTGAIGWLVYTQSLGVAHREATAAPIEALPVQEPPVALPEETSLTALDPFLANLADPSGKRYLRATFEIEVSPPPVVEEMHKKIAQIRDSILLVLTSKSYDEIRTTAGKGALREEIVTELNKILTNGKARQIFFKEFIVQ
jgi:flagellar FliL protein